jgi:hypothetical protein
VVLVRDDPAAIFALAQSHGEAKIQRLALAGLVSGHAVPNGGHKRESLPAVTSTSVKSNITGFSAELKNVSHVAM